MAAEGAGNVKAQTGTAYLQISWRFQCVVSFAFHPSRRPWKRSVLVLHIGTAFAIGDRVGLFNSKHGAWSKQRPHQRDAECTAV
ncbi:unnamed protein product [Leptosia nina]|uniref:Uncharacterized protein n=1 Tax=Leptosia nina TaxID=320188 RepID=A0AAV1IWQ7_9NEOP